MKFVYYFLGILICSSTTMFSQQISVDGSVSLQDLIEDNFVEGCVEISNITSSVNGSASGFSSYAYFDRASSSFPFQNGIMLSTGNATSGGNAQTTPTLSEGATNWGTDPDLETALGVTNTLNATSIEFDIISISSQLQFNYLFASEEYFDINPCRVSDGFAFLIKETASVVPYQNIAIVPGTATPVNTATIHDEIFGVCPAQNEQYFDGYNLGDTNYNGRTNVLTASTTITPYVQYHIKLIIADQSDRTFDSAVFIEGNSFKILDLGDDISTCASLATLNADIQNPLATYAWYLDNNLIASETSSTLNATQSGAYKVEVTVPLNSTDCTEEDEIIVVLNTEESINLISDYPLCDDSSGDGIETFTLSTKNTEVINNIPFTNYAFSYHYNETEARSNTNSITTPILNTSSPQQIFVRILDTDTGCFGYTSFNLVVNPLPTIVTPTPLAICDGDDTPDGFTVIDLTQKDSEITSGQTNLNVTYHYNPLDASNGNNPIPSPYVNTTTPSEQVYVRVIDLQTGCITTTNLTVNITTSPIVNRDTQFLDACDTDLDGDASFNLTDALNNIVGGLPANVTPTFHISYADADAGTNPIADPTNHQYANSPAEPGSATVYIRIEDDNTGCASIIPLEIHTNLLLTGTDTGDFALCDTNDNDSDTLEFNLNTVETFIANELPNITVTFFDTESDRDNNINPISKTGLYNATSPKVLYIRIDNGSCSEVADITLLVNPILLFNPANPVPYCDTDDDGTISIDLHSLDDMVTNSNTNFQVTYFSDPTDAQNNTNQLPPFYTNTSALETIYARIQNIATGCHTINSFQIEIILAPAANTPPNVVICDNDQDGFSIINLEDKIPEVVASTVGLNINFFTSFDDADNNTNVITVADRTAYNTNTQEIFIRVEGGTGCYNIVSFNAIVNTLPIIPTITNFQICESDGDSTADFLLVNKDAEILNGQTGKEVFYFEDSTFTLPIDKNAIYQNTSSPQTIYIRVQNTTDATCFDTASFILQVSPAPIYNTLFNDYLICDDSSNDGIHEFNLSEKITEIRQGSTDNLNVSFHLTEAAAQNNSNPLPTQYTNAINPQTIFIRIESSDSLCFVVEQLGINIIAAPNITQVTSPLIACDEDYDGLTTFNLETADFDILDRFQTNLIINYFGSFNDINQNDGLDNSNAISTPSNYPSNTKTAYIKVANTLTGCFSVISLELQVNLPPATNAIGIIQICDNDTNTYDLSQITDMIVTDTSIVNISYHNSPNDADTNASPIGNTFNYTANNHTIYIRVSDVTTNCPIVTSFILQINPNPIANTAPDLIACDDDFDTTNTLEFNLAQHETIILRSQDSNIFSVAYYNDSGQAFSNTPNTSLNIDYQALNDEIIFARVEHRTTGCFDVSQFTIHINPLPVIPINDVMTLCLNDLPLIIDANTGNSGDTYLWSNGATTSQIILNSAQDIGNYWVTATTPHIVGNDCSYTHPFSVIESEDATINFTTTVDFADPNSITVDISGIGDYVYLLDGGEPQTSNIFNNVTLGLHIVTIRDLNGCKDVSKEVVVIDVPKFVTPNSDGDFDTWHIVGIEQLPGTVVYVYNRHGKLLKTLPHTSPGWDGTFNGHNMPSDDYWYVANVIYKGEELNLKGHFALKR